MLQVFHAITLGLGLVAGLMHPGDAHARVHDIVTQAWVRAEGKPSTGVVAAAEAPPTLDFDRRAAGVARYDAEAAILKSDRIAQAKAQAKARAKARARAAAEASLRVSVASRAPRPATLSAGPASVRAIITAAFSRLGQGAVAWAQRVAVCESGDNPAAVSPTGYLGLFQFARATWEGTPYATQSPFSATANAGAAAWLYSRDGPSQWGCR
ncbi:MAG: transglycosylase family protein [Candidatus Dormibacterales bacterium]